MEEIFQLAEVAKLTGLPKHTVKQWTTGRPYTIKPSVRVAPEQGIANLYSFDDALRFAMAAHLTRDGFMSSVIKAALDGFRKHMISSSKYTHCTMAIVSGGVWWVNILTMDMVARAELEKNISVYVLDLGRLRDDLLRKIAARAK